MQIRTALAIGFGVSIGMVFGMGVSEKKKERIVNYAKKKLIFAMTGEDWRPKKKGQVKPVNYTTYHKAKPLTTDDERIWKNLKYENATSAFSKFDDIQDLIHHFGSMSVFDLGEMTDKTVDYSWRRYGWTADECRSIKVIEEADGKWVIQMPEPEYLAAEFNL